MEPRPQKPPRNGAKYSTIPIHEAIQQEQMARQVYLNNYELTSNSVTTDGPVRSRSPGFRRPPPIETNIASPTTSSSRKKSPSPRKTPKNPKKSPTVLNLDSTSPKVVMIDVEKEASMPTNIYYNDNFAPETSSPSVSTTSPEIELPKARPVKPPRGAHGSCYYGNSPYNNDNLAILPESVTPASRLSFNPFDGDADDGPGVSSDTAIGISKLSPTGQQQQQQQQQQQDQIQSLEIEENYDENALRPPKKLVLRDVELNNRIYYQSTFSPTWLSIACIIHSAQLAVLLSASRNVLDKTIFVILVIFAFIVVALMVWSRFFVHMRRHSWYIMKDRKSFVPEDEADDVPNLTIYALAIAAVLEGFLYAVIAILTAGVSKGLDDDYHSQNTILQALRFGSITLLAIHRILRPANRADPVRTILELEVVSVCWDALDGSTLCELIDGRNLSPGILAATQALMVFWYFSVGIRMAFMFLTHLPPNSIGYKLVLTQPLAISPQPTVDRTMQGLRLRSLVILAMAGSEFYAAAIRITLWSKGMLDAIQQDMTIKNLLFLSAVLSAYTMRSNANNRDWNSPELGFGIRYPSREFQVEFFRYMFAIVYVVQGMLLSLILIQVSQDHFKWLVNIGMDILLAVFFLALCKNVHVQRGDLTPKCFLVPKEGFVIFPAYQALIFSIIMMLNLFVARIPAIFYSYNNMNDDTISDKVWAFDNALMVINMSVITIGSCGMFWSLSYMVFRKEFTASPGNYNAIHDPTINMVATSTMIEGALDVLSCSALLQLAPFDLPDSMRGACVIFSLLELANACQSFGLQALLSGGHDDTPMDLVKWKASLRMFRFFIDCGTFVLRTLLWVQYRAISSVFLIKNLYNLLHTIALIERSYGIHKYPKGTLFTEFVTPMEWYGMTKEQWRHATRHTVAAQARAGRSV